jgi:hypothetical protein
MTFTRNKIPWLALFLLLGTCWQGSNQILGFQRCLAPTVLWPHTIQPCCTWWMRMSTGVELSLFRQTDGSASWQSEYLFPQTGITFIYLDMPADTILGDALAAMAFIDMPIGPS